MTQDAFLALEDVDKWFAGVHALNRVSLRFTRARSTLPAPRHRPWQDRAGRCRYRCPSRTSPRPRASGRTRRHRIHAGRQGHRGSREGRHPRDAPLPGGVPEPEGVRGSRSKRAGRASRRPGRSGRPLVSTPPFGFRQSTKTGSSVSRARVLGVPELPVCHLLLHPTSNPAAPGGGGRAAPSRGGGRMCRARFRRSRAAGDSPPLALLECAGEEGHDRALRPRRHPRRHRPLHPCLRAPRLFGLRERAHRPEWASTIGTPLQLQMAAHARAALGRGDAIAALPRVTGPSTTTG